MEIKDRLRNLRRQLDLTQAEFAERIGSVQNTITGYENGRRQPSGAVISLICKEFNVNEEWLRDGVGEMFKAAPSTILDQMAEHYSFTHRDYVAVEKFANLNRQRRDVILDFMREVVAAFDDVEADTPAVASGAPELGEIDIEAEVAAYRRMLEIQKKAAAGSSASNGIGGAEKDHEAV